MPVVFSKFIILLLDPRERKKRKAKQRREKKEKKRKEKKSQNNLWPIANDKVFLPVPFYQFPSQLLIMPTLKKIWVGVTFWKV